MPDRVKDDFYYTDAFEHQEQEDDYHSLDVSCAVEPHIAFEKLPISVKKSSVPNDDDDDPFTKFWKDFFPEDYQRKHYKKQLKNYKNKIEYLKRFSTTPENVSTGREIIFERKVFLCDEIGHNGAELQEDDDHSRDFSCFGEPPIACETPLQEFDERFEQLLQECEDEQLMQAYEDLSIDFSCVGETPLAFEQEHEDHSLDPPSIGVITFPRPSQAVVSPSQMSNESVFGKSDESDPNTIELKTIQKQKRETPLTFEQEHEDRSLDPPSIGVDTFPRPSTAIVSPSQMSNESVLGNSDESDPNIIYFKSMQTKKFGRDWLTNEVSVPKRVEKAYRKMRKVDDAGQYGIHQNLTAGSMQSNLEAWSIYAQLKKDSIVLDLGSGCGYVAVHAALLGVMVLGVECDKNRNCFSALWNIYTNVLKNPDPEVNHRCYTLSENIENMVRYDPATHVYMFNDG